MTRILALFLIGAAFTATVYICVAMGQIADTAGIWETVGIEVLEVVEGIR